MEKCKILGALANSFMVKTKKKKHNTENIGPLSWTLAIQLHGKRREEVCVKLKRNLRNYGFTPGIYHEARIISKKLEDIYCDTRST